MKKYLVLAFFISAAFLAYTVYFRQGQKQVSASPPPQATPSPTIQPSQETVQYPVGDFHDKKETEDASSKHDRNVTLDESGPTFESALKHLIGEETVDKFVNIQDFARRAVVSIDNLPNRHLSKDYWPVKPAPGNFQVSSQDHGWIADPKNQERYTPYLAMINAIDSQEAVDLYVRLYPLFQQAYDDLGNQHYFNDRVVQVIDHLLQAPVPASPPKLVRAIESYHYEDPHLESLSIGQKTLMKLGPENEEKAKASLRDLRQRLTHLSTHSSK